ncbi:MAG: hypothetical protein JRI23_27645 [Deltaproteobacteria bacterium]|nr:hypothetical protein [Deltaproteobacteria bacterium]MBW2535855.1 hypothetical protein [Deltaproteobacteria bacterium]
MAVLRALGIGVALALAGCGGSSSETPWPVEPLDADPGPLGEAPPRGDATDVGTPDDWDEEQADAGVSEP